MLTVAAAVGLSPASANAASMSWAWALAGQVAAEDATSDTRAKKQKRRRRRRRSTTRRRQRSASPESSAVATSVAQRVAGPQQDAERRAAQDRSKRILEGRKKSRVTEGTPSRWSNRGAMVPVVSEVPITQALPARAVPRPAGVQTVGQRLQGDEPLVFARGAVGYYRLETMGQGLEPLDLLRARTTVSAQRIARTQLGLQIDAEFRPQLSGANRNRPTDIRVNELYLSWGRTDWRRRRTGSSWGVALGRVAIREAGYAQADGLAARFRIIPELMLGFWGGVTGNPYGYNWQQQDPQLISADWITGGGFASLLIDRFSLNVAGGTTYANVNNEQDFDRVYIFVDSAYTVTRGFNLLFNGWLDMLPDGQTIQNIDLMAAYNATSDLSFSLAVGRFSTVLYRNTEGATFVVDPNVNRAAVGDAANDVIRDANGDPINVFDGALLAAVYNSIRFRARYRFLPSFEAFVQWNTLLRDTSVSDDETANVANAVSDFSTVRSIPTVGLRYRNPKILNASAGYTHIIDEEATATSIIRGRLSRSWQGLFASADVRAFFGNIGGFDGGVDLGYTLPRSWTPGRLTLRGAFRYYRENVAIVVPSVLDADPVNVGEVPPNQTLLPNQETIFGFAGVDWRY